MPIQTKIETITPTKAEQMLESNTSNRPQRAATIAEYARDMAAGRWQMTAEPIKFAADGTLLDGQHRLRAVVRSRMSVAMMVVRGLEHEAQGVMDAGRRRSASNALQLAGHANASVVAGAARLALAVDRGEQGGSRYSNAEISEYVDTHPALVDAAVHAKRLSRAIDAPAAVIAVAWITFSRIDPETCSTFFESLTNNATNGVGDPRNTLLRRLTSIRRTREHVSLQTYLALFIRAWNAHRAGENLTVLKTRTVTSNGMAAVSLPSAV